MEGNSVGLISNYAEKAKTIKPCFAINKEIKEAEKLYGMDLENKDKSVIVNDFKIDAIKDNFNPPESK